PAPHDEMDVLVSLRKEDRAPGPSRVAQERERALVVLLGGQVPLGEVAGAEAEVIRVGRDAGHADAGAAECPREREPGPEQAVDDRRPRFAHALAGDEVRLGPAATSSSTADSRSA